MNYSNLENFCYFVKDKINVDKLNNNNYISTENMLPNKGGKTKATKIPNTKTTQAYNKNDILVSNIRPYFKKIWKANTIGGCSNDVLVFRANTEVSPEFLFYVLSNDTFFNYSMSTSKGTKMPRGDKKALMQYKVPNLEYNMQKKIASILSALDDKIELNNKINKNLEEMAQAIFKSWFVDFEPWGGEMPDDWEYGEIQNFYNITIGKTPPRKEPQWFSIKNSDIPWVSISNMKDCGMFINSTSEYLTEKAVDKFNVRVVPKRSILLSFKLTIGRVAIANKKMTTNEAIAHFEYKKNNSMEYLYCYLKSFKYSTLGSTSSIATAVNSKIIKAMPFILPNKKCLHEFHSLTKPIFKQILNNQNEINSLTNLRNTLLPKLMSGELDVSNLDI